MTDLEADGKVQELQGSCEDVAEERGGPMVGRTAAARRARAAEQSRQLAAYSGNHHHHLPMPHIPAKPRRVNSHQVHPQFSVGIPDLHMLQALVPMNTCPSPVHHERGSKIVNVMQNSYVTMQSSCQCPFSSLQLRRAGALSKRMKLEQGLPGALIKCKGRRQSSEGSMCNPGGGDCWAGEKAATRAEEQN